MAQLSKQFGLHPNQICGWKNQLLESNANVFGDIVGVEAPVDLVPLHAKIG